MTAVKIAHADNTSAQNFGDILNQGVNNSNTGANQNNNGNVNTGSATGEQGISNTINTSATGCNCTPTPSVKPTDPPTQTPTPTPTGTPGGGDGGCHDNCGGGSNKNNNGGGSGGGVSTGQVLGLSATSGESQILQTLTLVISFLSAAGGAFLLKKNA